MSWVEDQFERRLSSNKQQAGAGPAETKFEGIAENKWNELVDGLHEDVAEYRRLGGEADFEQTSKSQCRVLNVSAGIASTVTADFNAHTIQYTFEAEGSKIAVPEGGFFSLRRSGRAGADIYSADQKVTIEQARRMVLEPLLFPAPPHIM
jgi:hypothetical protein